MLAILIPSFLRGTFMHISLLPGADHFSVEEIPAYLPSGSGEHLYVLIEKRGLTTDEAASRLARCCQVKDRDIGYAGRKDRKSWFHRPGSSS